MVRAFCGSCGLRMKVPDNFTASLGRCPRCGEIVVNPMGELRRKNWEHVFKNMLFWSRFFEIRYDELTLFLLSSALLLAVMVNINVIIGWCVKLWETSFLQILGFVVLSGFIILVYVSGFFLSLYHVFTKRLKSGSDKAVMIFFAVATNSLSGVAAAYYMYIDSVWRDRWYLGIFPLWVFLNSIFLVAKLPGSHDEFDDVIADENASLGQVFSASVVLLIVFGLCHFVFNLNWAITFSISVVYATSFSKAFRELIPNRINAQTAEKINDQRTQSV